MFNHHSESRKKGGFFPFTIFRLFLSLIMLSVFGLGIYQAFRYFSGVDPLKLDPKSIVISLLTSGEVNQFIFTAFGGNPPVQVLDLQNKLVSSGGDPEVLSATPADDLMQAPGFQPAADRQFILKLAVVADSHNDNGNLSKALSQAKDSGAKFVIGLGDYTDTGTQEELEKAKQVFSSSGLPYYLTAGDHDLWAARDRKLTAETYFNQIFGSAYQSFSDSTIRFIIVYNSDNYEGLDSFQMSWLEEQLQKTRADGKFTFVFLHEPIFHPSSDRYMGKLDPQVKKQADELRLAFKDAGVVAVLAGDVHSFTKYQDPGGLNMTTVGAITRERNTQTPRFALIDIFSDGSYNIEDIEVK